MYYYNSNLIRRTIHFELTGMYHQIKADAEHQVWSDDPLLSMRHDTALRIKLLFNMMINLLHTHLQWANLMKEKFYDQVRTLYSLNKAFLKNFLIHKKKCHAYCVLRHQFHIVVTWIQKTTVWWSEKLDHTLQN